MTDKETFIVLHGARKNVGDFLIKERSIQLISSIRPDRSLIEFPHWQSLDNELGTINKSKALIIMGSPGIQQNAYPEVFKLTSNLDDIKVPIVLLGVGAYMLPFNERSITTFKFSSKTIQFFRKCTFFSVRDLFTKRLLN